MGSTLESHGVASTQVGGLQSTPPHIGSTLALLYPVNPIPNDSSDKSQPDPA